MVAYNNSNQIDITAYDRIKEYFRVDKRLGGLIKVFVSKHVSILGREIEIIIPDLDRNDIIKINHIEYVRKEGDN